MELTAEQVRVLGCLMEKEATTPDQYPLSSNALTVACNQKSSRHPVVAYPTSLVDQTMLDLRAAKLARTVHAAGQRAPKHKHVLDETWGLSPGQLAVLAVLMLRGPNTVHELRSRTERYVSFASDDDVTSTLQSLTTLDPPMAKEIGRASGQRETRFHHVLSDPALEPAEPPEIPAPHTAVPDERGSTGPGPAEALTHPDVAVEQGSSSSEIDALRVEVDALKNEVSRLHQHLDRLSKSLGEPMVETREGRQ